MWTWMRSGPLTARRCARRSRSRATVAAACCRACGRCSTLSPVATTCGWRCSPATSAPRPRSSWPRSRCGDYFSWGAFADDAIERDDLIRIAHARHETEHGRLIEPEAVVVIGDTPHDIRCARAGGAKAVAVATGNYDLEALRGHQPDALFADLTDTDAVLEVLLR